MFKSVVVCAVFLVLAFSESVFAGKKEDMAEMQKRLNAEVMEKPFSVEDEEKIDAYIKDAMQKDLKPIQKAPNYWKKGFTCADIYSYGWDTYQSCRYHRSYYGRYWF